MKKILFLLAFISSFAFGQTYPSPTYKTITLPSSGFFYANNGGHVSRLNDRFFIGAATLNDGNSAPTAMDWTGTSFLNGGIGAFAYLENNGTLNMASPYGKLAGVFATRASDTTGGAGVAAIGVSSLAINDNAQGAGASTWNFYGTTVRTATATGPATQAMETDVANLGPLVTATPASPNPVGVTMNQAIAVGGELAGQTGAGYTFNPVSAAINIYANNPSGYANVKYDKGIIIAGNALTAAGIAIALYQGYAMDWYNASNQIVSSISSTAVTPATGQSIVISPFGTLVNNANDGKTQFQVENNVGNAANYVAVSASVSGSPPFIAALGTDANIPLQLIPKASEVQISGPFSHTGQERDTSYTFSTPTTGTTVTLATGTETAIIAPAGTLAALTVTLPSCAAGYDGSLARFSSTQVITALTVNATSGTVADAATSLAVGGGNEYLCRGATTTWYRLY